MSTIACLTATLMKVMEVHNTTWLLVLAYLSWRTCLGTRMSGSYMFCSFLPFTAATLSGLTYSGWSDAKATYAVGSAIASNSPTLATGTATSFAVTPALPAGLSLDLTSGSVTGTPTAATSLATYTFTATDSVTSSTTSVSVQITVLPSMIALQSGNGGKYCSDQQNGVVCTSTQITGWEKFTVTSLSSSTVSLKGSRNNQYCSDGDTAAGVICSAASAGGWETYTVNVLSASTLTLKGGRDHNYCSDRGNAVVCNQAAAGGWETFTYQDASVNLCTPPTGTLCNGLSTATGVCTTPTCSAGYAVPPTSANCASDGATWTFGGSGACKGLSLHLRRA